ncbi:hypothetical protein F0L68_11730 [Solihabitans fulvus]|uniref:Lipoprotein n=1 Tax=Solihabitans fulvus TaxID=1892852 RepID=A0A5B2XIK7_9PSEU|nr:hypothetical protein [Solihabitans fulvus]KAA2262572.1 hypothetical protein F0L68_11730 [Solihabitans fulvus]
MTIRNRGVAGIVGVAALLALAGCSTTEPPPAKVATLQTSGATDAPSSAQSSAARPSNADADRPRYRLDMTGADRDRMLEPWTKCMADHGVKPPSGTGVTDPGSGADKSSPAAAACMSKYPLPPWEYDKNNPESMDFVHKMVLCLRQKGVKEVTEDAANNTTGRNGFALGGPNNDSESVSKGLAMAPVCEKELSTGGTR